MASKTVKFSIEFDEPTRDEVLTVSCPFCKAEAGGSCVVKSYDFTKTHPTKTLHHERVASYMNLEPVKGQAWTYRIKP